MIYFFYRSTASLWEQNWHLTMLTYSWPILRTIMYLTTTSSHNITNDTLMIFFFIWNNTSDELDHFINHLNTVHPTIKFTKTTSDVKITYLDLDIYIKNKTIHTKLILNRLIHSLIYMVTPIIRHPLLKESTQVKTFESSGTHRKM